MGNATYELVQPVAWDEITVSAEAVVAVAKASAFIFGSLAGRSPYNREQVGTASCAQGSVEILRRQSASSIRRSEAIVELAARADVIKLNHDEVGQIASWLRTGKATPNPPGNADAVAEACATLSKQQTRLGFASLWVQRAPRCGIGATLFPLRLQKWSSRTRLAPEMRSWPA